MVVDVIAVLGALALAASFGLPGLQRAARRRRQAFRACTRCGRVLVLGERTCDCAD
jgi:hypothetical protein